MRVAAIVQARTTSKRFPKKVLKDLPYGSGVTVLEHVIKRLKKSNMLAEIIVATTINPEDDPIVEISRKEGVKCFRGSEKDVLGRYYQCARKNNIDIIARITSDCPCIDWNVVDKAINKLLKDSLDYVGVERSYPHGCGDVEVFTFSSLEVAHREANRDFEREHVCPYIYKTAPQKFRIALMKAETSLYAPDIRVTLDTPEDYALLCVVFEYLYPQKKFFATKDIIELFLRKPWLKLINYRVIQKKIYDSFEEELKEAMKVLELQELNRVKKFLEEVCK